MMIKLKKGLIALLAATAAILCALALLLSVKSAGADTVSLENDGNGFSLTENYFSADEKFVFTATASIEYGNAAGLVFGAEGDNKWVFNIDRSANLVKLIYFTADGDKVYFEENYIGNDKMTQGEREMVNPKVAQIDKVQLKVVITPEDGKVNAEFYADNIRRFAFNEKGEDKFIDLNGLENGLTYTGGNTGFNCFKAKVTFTDEYTGASDYSYYTELYRQQYHFSQYAHWNNDPNGLVYYNGYYHLFYQHHPYNNYWGDMYWGHARSKDLAHWELLPICLFPDKDFGGREREGYMWSGSAMVYHAGMSSKIDEENWFENGTGLIGFYTRDGFWQQDQVVMSSDDGGITWTKRVLVRQELVFDEGKTSCRDPKVFPVTKSGDKVTLWGMALTGMETDNVWFLKSENLVDWSYAGGFKASRPECPDVVTLEADDGKVKTVMTFTGRQYLVGEIVYEGNEIKFLVDGHAPQTGDFQTMDFGPDSYATQSFYIDDKESEYYGETVALSWFSGVPGAEPSIDSGTLAAARKVWNGSGMTIPVIYGLKKTESGYTLTQTPIVKDSKAFTKSEIYSGENVQVAANGANILENLDTHLFELDAKVHNPQLTPVYFRVNMLGNEYTEIGWNENDGYYVDRSHTGDAGMSMGNYSRRYSKKGGDGANLSFYILSDNGGVEVYCEDFTIPFYVLTFSSPYATAATFTAEGDVTVNMNVNAISSVWRKDAQAEGTVLHVDAQEIILDRTLTVEKEITAYSVFGGDIEWSVVSGENVVSVEKTATGAKIKSLSAGSAVVAVSCGDIIKKIPVSVYSGNADSDLTFNAEGKISGDWYLTGEGLKGVKTAGDGFILSEYSAADFTYAVNFKLEGAAAALVFRASKGADGYLSDYIIANYDNNGKVVKMWSPNGEIANVKVEELGVIVDVNSILLKVEAYGDSVKVYINDRLVIDVTLGANEPKAGLLGLNTCAATTTFSSIVLVKTEYEYGGSGEMKISGETVQYVDAVYNRTSGNVKLNPAFYTVDGRHLKISEEYFATLGKTGEYVFTVKGAVTSFDIKLNVTAVPQVKLYDLTVEQGCNAVINVGATVIAEVYLNGTKLENTDYKVENGVLTVYADKLAVGSNTITFGDKSLTVTVSRAQLTDVQVQAGNGNLALIISLPIVCGVLLGGAAALAVILVRKKKKQLPKEENVGDDN